MLYCKSTNKRINLFHHRMLWLPYDNCELTFEVLLEKDRSFTIFRYHVLNNVKCTIICHKTFSAICLHETALFIKAKYLLRTEVNTAQKNEVFY